MAAVMRLANYDQTLTIDLLDGTLKLAEGSWSTQTTAPAITYEVGMYGGPGTFAGYSNVIETFSLIGRDTVSNLTSAIVDLEQIASDVRRWQTGRQYAETWWMEWYADGESPKRELIRAMSMSFPSGACMGPLMDNTSVRVDVTITRHPLRESVSSTTLTYADMDNSGAKKTINPIGGTELARLEQTEISGGGTTLDEIWLGIRPWHGGFSAFEPVFECEDGTNGGDAADYDDEAGGPEPSGDVVRVTFATATLALRWHTTLDSFLDGGTWVQLNGSYLVLLRCRVTDGATIGIQLRTGLGTYSLVEQEEVIVENDSYYLVPLGEIIVPPWNEKYLESANLNTNFKLAIYAEKLSSGENDYLYMDQIILIPSEHLLYIANDSNDSASIFNIFTLPDDSSVAYNQYTSAGEIAMRDWRIPPEGGMIVLAAQRMTSHTIGVPVSVKLHYLTRWLSYRNDVSST